MLIPNFQEQEIEINPVDLPAWLSEQDLFPKFYWKSKESNTEIAAVGALVETDRFPLLPQETASSCRFFGAIPFSQNRKGSLWNSLASSYFFLPQIEIVQSIERTVLKNRGKPFVFNPPVPLAFDPLELSERSDIPSMKEWDLCIENVLSLIDAKQIEKAVLARKTSFATTSQPFSWLAKLLQSSINSVVFAFQRSADALFLGASPEMLYQRKGRYVMAESIAGTRKRGCSPSEDALIGSALKNSIKDKKEFHCVKRFLCETLSDLCEEFSYQETDTLFQTSELQHIYNCLQGILKPEVNDLTLLNNLHPTPAVGGSPRKQALSIIDPLETFDRGLYAGTLGWFSPLEASFVVAIRSALISSGHLHAFAGTGIVEGSVALQEWEELEDKISQWKSLCPR